MNEKKEPMVVISGPTASGKSEIAVKLAKRIGGSVISADSMQVYRGLDIGTAKITEKEMEGIPHYLIDVADPKEEFHVVRYQGLARQAVDEIRGMGRLPILCGGTGFYIQALLYGIDFTDEGEDRTFRASLTALAEKEGKEALHRMLSRVDEKAAEEIHPNNVKRVIRALEFYHLSGIPISEHNAAERRKEPVYQSAFFCITMDRERLYQRIDERVDLMMEKGLLEEVRSLKEQGLTRSHVSMQGLSYQELLSYLEGEISLEEAVRIIKRDSRHYAKRQLTWMRRERDVIWIDRDEFPDSEAIALEMEAQLREKGILDNEK